MSVGVIASSIEKKIKFDSNVTVKKDQHYILHIIEDRGYKGIYDHTNFRHLDCGIKISNLKYSKYPILYSYGYCYSFYGMVNLYKDLIQKYS